MAYMNPYGIRCRVQAMDYGERSPTWSEIDADFEPYYEEIRQLRAEREQALLEAVEPLQIADEDETCSEFDQDTEQEQEEEDLSETFSELSLTPPRTVNTPITLPRTLELPCIYKAVETKRSLKTAVTEALDTVTRIFKKKTKKVEGFTYLPTPVTDVNSIPIFNLENIVIIAIKKEEQEKKVGKRVLNTLKNWRKVHPNKNSLMVPAMPPTAPATIGPRKRFSIKKFIRKLKPSGKVEHRNVGVVIVEYNIPPPQCEEDKKQHIQKNNKFNALKRKCAAFKKSFGRIISYKD